MMKVIKTGLVYLAAVLVSVLIVMFVNLAHRYQLEPKEVYKVYLDGKVVGNVKDKEELEDYKNIISHIIDLFTTLMIKCIQVDNKKEEG